MNLRQLEILRSVIRHRTTVAAADELALSQPAVSNALKTMEAQAGFALFERVNNRLFPTTEAMALYKESEAIFALHAKLENRVRDLRENRSGHLALVATPPLAYSIIPSALSGFLRRRPETRVFFDVRRYEGIIEGVLNRVFNELELYRVRDYRLEQPLYLLTDARREPGSTRWRSTP